MTTAKPKPMAGQTDTADDLIAELARLMAEDAQSDKPKVETKPVRIPGEPGPLAQPVAAAAQPASVPRFDFAPAQDGPAASPPPVRIPGQAPSPAAEARPLPFSFERPPARAEAPPRV
ncbi:MAG: hypothetical protein KIS86_17305, partial [Devosia sp.]|nr:hypothetical protein [Devosia sp.]